MSFLSHSKGNSCGSGTAGGLTDRYAEQLRQDERYRGKSCERVSAFRPVSYTPMWSQSAQ
jgi:hypothetical protein